MSPHTEASPGGNPIDAHEVAALRNAEPMIHLSEPSSLPLSGHERHALIAALYVVKDNWWLTEVEERVLRRLELLASGDDEATAGTLAA